MIHREVTELFMKICEHLMRRFMVVIVRPIHPIRGFHPKFTWYTTMAEIYVVNSLKEKGSELLK